ncbi:hypothetical protein KEM55_009373 [Ascosphaera atra]|nr:hypothetical protein KEM55_009373 [Ascosphaera atra]
MLAKKAGQCSENSRPGKFLRVLSHMVAIRVPKPDNPDTFSSLAAERYVLLGGVLPDYLRPSAISPEVPDLSLFQQVVHDLGLLRRRLVAQITGAFSGAVTTHGKKPFAAAPTAYETGGVLDAGEVVEAYHEVENAPVPRPLEETSSFDGFTELFSTELHEPDQGSQAMFDSSHSIEIGHVEINGDDSQELAATEEQPTEPPAPTTSLDRLEQGLPDNSTIPAPDDASSSLSPTVNGVGADGEPELNDPLSNSTVDSKQLSELVKPNQEVGHRMTLLSCYPAESLCWQLSHTVVELLLHHLVSIHYRNVATYFLSTRPSRMAFFDGSPYTGVRPVFALCGGGSLSEKMKYFSDIMLLTGLRFLDRALLWHVVGCLTAISGVKKFEWWKLRAD